MPFFIAALRVGQRAFGSVPEMMRALAPLVMSDWITGSCDAGVSVVPLVSWPISPSCFKANSAPWVFTLSAVVKYELPRFFGTTKTFRPFLSVGAASAGGANEVPTIAATAALAKATLHFDNTLFNFQLLSIVLRLTSEGPLFPPISLLSSGVPRAAALGRRALPRLV